MYLPRLNLHLARDASWTGLSRVKEFFPGHCGLLWMKKDDLKEANELWRTPDVLRQLSMRENNSNIEEEERALALEMQKLELRERRAKVRSLELRNIQLENELQEQLE
ncbi:hypothetical protein C1646_678572 [Rhizophagus diaphanus]|nr:hypothetical protein C1646_678572 [Rhizophagus diaphanus] [Rhizophagus sp. MUCL 43196]